ncbi:hypothetical protein [Streptomyces canus]|uniref:hypothetical protein n=1 Tax=Streptomyces canus TaxID=58343 RepID=UPI003247FE36
MHLAAAFPHVAGAVEYAVVWEPRRQRALRGTLRPDGGQLLRASRSIVLDHGLWRRSDRDERKKTVRAVG